MTLFDVVRVGIVGTGSIARDQHAPACAGAKNAILHSVLSRTEEGANHFAAEFSEQGPVRAFSRIGDFLDDPALDAVVLANPDAVHFEYAMAAMEAGKHVLVEKPLALTLEQGRQLITVADSRGLKLGVGFHLRWHPAIRAALDLLKAGRIGQLRHVGMRWTFQRTSVEDWRADPELSRWWSLSGVGAHCIDLMHLVADELGLIRSSFTASSIRDVIGSLNEETTAVTITFQGVTAQILSSVLFRSDSDLTFFGSAGTLSCTGVLGRANPGVLTLNGETVPYAFENPYVLQLEGFCAAVSANGDYRVPGAVGLAVLADLEAIE